MRGRWGNLIPVSLVVILALVFSLAGCGAGAETPAAGPTLPMATAPSVPPKATATASAAPAAAMLTVDPGGSATPAATTAATATPPLSDLPLPGTGLEPPTLNTAIPAIHTTVPPEPRQDALALPDPAGFTWRPVVSDLSSPVGLAHAGDGSGRLFVLEQAGTIRVIQDGALLPEPFLNIIDRVGSQGNEQGLLGLAFHPQYSQNGYFYVNYTDKNGDTVIARFQVSPGKPNQADPASEKQLLTVDQPYPNHNGGAVTFGPDGYLYLGLGDGGSAGDPQGNAQSFDTLLGKILRIDVNGGDPYAIPADNPFANGGGRPEIWAYGLRNPWRIAFDRQTGDLYIADVGQNQYEEIDFVRAGSSGRLNFGWNFFEASHPYKGQPLANEVFIAPVAEYSHSQGCSVTGGEVYRGQHLSQWQGVYLYSDFCTGNVWGLLRDGQGTWQNALLFSNVGQVTSFGLDEAGEIYLVDRSGTISMLDQK
jgi:glucose/arabinose dehydrogenase